MKDDTTRREFLKRNIILATFLLFAKSVKDMLNIWQRQDDVKISNKEARYYKNNLTG